MSYEHCEKHDDDATNGCVQCIREKQESCDHRDSQCNECGLYVRGFTKEQSFGFFIGEFFSGAVEAFSDELAIAYLELGLRWLHDRAKESYWVVPYGSRYASDLGRAR